LSEFAKQSLINSALNTMFRLGEQKPLALHRQVAKLWGNTGEHMTSLSFQSPIGVITLTREGDDITSLRWTKTPPKREPPPKVGGVLLEAKAQLLAYFRGDLRRFDLSMSCPSTPFEHGVMESMMSISYGRTKTYGEIAGYVGGSAQAVGAACGTNPLPILIPCHRVVGSNNLGGYSGAGGIESKVFLLRLEGGGGLLL